MFPLLLSPLLGGLGSLIKTGTGLAGAGVKSAFKAMSSTKQSVEDAQEVAAQGTAAEESGGGGNGDKDEGGGKDEKKIKKSMFGGLDLANIKSQIDGPMGPPEPVEEVKGGVYKQIFAVNKSMLASLLGMEKSLKMLLSIEYERIQGMMSDGTDERQDSLDKAETDPTKKTGNKFGGLLGRAASGVGGMLGSAYSKAKGGLSGNFGKLLGIGALIIAFKKYPDEIKAAFKKILKFFKSVYDYFSADDFTFTKFKSDLASKFLPAVKKFLGDSMEWLWGAIKGVASEFLFGAKGDKRIRQESGQATQAKSNAATIMKEAGVKMENLNILGSNIQNIEVDGKKISKEDSDKLTKQHQDLYLALNQISRKSEGRIQWTGLGDLNKTLRGNRAAAANVNVMDLLNAQPIVDGRIMSMKDLETIEMNKLGGITRGMTDDKQKEIKDALAKKTTLVMQKMNLESDTYDPNKIQDFGDALMGALTIGKTGEEYYALEKADKIKVLEEALLKVEEDLEYSGQVFMQDDAQSISGTTGVSANTGSLATTAQIKAKEVRDMLALIKLERAATNVQPGRNIMTSTNIDQSSNSIINSSMAPFSTSDTVKAFKSKQLENLR